MKLKCVKVEYSACTCMIFPITHVPLKSFLCPDFPVLELLPVKVSPPGVIHRQES